MNTTAYAYKLTHMLQRDSCLEESGSLKIESRNLIRR